LNEKVESLEREKAQLSAELASKATSLAELNQRISQIEQALSTGANAKAVSR
jgi:prefoldin subunit 5